MLGLLSLLIEIVVIWMSIFLSIALIFTVLAGKLTGALIALAWSRWRHRR